MRSESPARKAGHFASPMSARLSKAVSLGSVLGAVAVAFADSSIVVLALPDLLREYDS